MGRPTKSDPVRTVRKLGAKWSPDLDAYASGKLGAGDVRCVLCGHAPCDCPPFGSAGYLAMADRLHSRNGGAR